METIPGPRVATGWTELHPRCSTTTALLECGEWRTSPLTGFSSFCSTQGTLLPFCRVASKQPRAAFLHRQPMALADTNKTLPSSPVALARSISGEMPLIEARAGVGEGAPAKRTTPQPTPEAQEMNSLRRDDRYLFVRIIGRGSMGSVFLAKHARLGSAVAIKVMHEVHAGDPGLRRRFLNEAHVGSSVNSDHVVRVSDCDTLRDNRPYFVMEYVTGPTLAEALGRQHPMGVSKVLRIAWGIASGLARAHEQGIVHRDLKPENVLLMDRAEHKDFVKVLDFGIAKLRRCEDATELGTVFGTPQYLSPEQAFGQSVDHRADVYSLGAILYEMLAGRPLFRGNTAVELVTQHRHSFPVPLRHLRGMEQRVSLKVERIVQTCLRKAPEERYQTMAALGDALKDAHRDVIRRLKSEQTRSAVPPSERANLNQTVSPPSQSKAGTANTDRPTEKLPSALDDLGSETAMIEERHWLGRLLPVLLMGIVVGVATSFAFQWLGYNASADKGDAPFGNKSWTIEQKLRAQPALGRRAPNDSNR